MSINYTPAEWPGDNNWAKINQGNQFTSPDGRRCRMVCEPSRPQRPNPQNPQQASRMLLGRNMWDARRIYPNTREVVRNGQPLPTTRDYDPSRINVETRNGVINRIAGFY